jgi:predicted Zn-dependent peptidase
MKVYRRVLENGLRVLVAPRKSLESVAIVIGVNFGSIDESKRLNGLAHFIEHMLFKGTRKRSWTQINEITRSYGILYNAETDYEATMYEAVVYRRYLDKAMDLISDMVRNPVFDSKELKLERGPILHEIAMRREDPDSILYDNMPRTIFSEDGKLMPPDSGAIASRIRRQDLVKAYEKYYNPRNMSLTIYGGISADEAFELAKKYMSGFNRKHVAPERHAFQERKRTEKLYIRKKDIERGEIGIGFPCRGIAGDAGTALAEYVAMDAIAELLSNRIYDKVREEHGLSYDPGVDYEPYGTFGYLMASAGAATAKLESIKSIMLSEFARLKRGGVRKTELDEVKKGLGIKYAMGLDHVLDSAIEISEMELMYGDGRMLEHIQGELEKLDMKTILRYIKEYITPSKYGEIILRKS